MRKGEEGRENVREKGEEGREKVREKGEEVTIIQFQIHSCLLISLYSLVVYFSPYAYPLYYTSDLLARGFPAAI